VRSPAAPDVSGLRVSSRTACARKDSALPCVTWPIYNTIRTAPRLQVRVLVLHSTFRPHAAPARPAQAPPPALPGAAAGPDNDLPPSAMDQRRKDGHSPPLRPRLPVLSSRLGMDAACPISTG